MQRSARAALWLRGLTLLVWLLVIFGFSATPGSSYSLNPPLWYFLERKSAHVIEYAVLMLLTLRFASALFPKEKFKNIVWLSAAFALTYGATDELHQLFVPFRGAKFTDVLVDGLGVLIMSLFLFLLSLGQRKK